MFLCLMRTLERQFILHQVVERYERACDGAFARRGAFLITDCYTDACVYATSLRETCYCS